MIRSLPIQRSRGNCRLGRFRCTDALAGVVLGALLLITWPLSLRADTGEEAEAAFAQFLSAFTASDLEGVLSLFADDALFWGTGSQSLVESPDGIRQYFSAMANRAPGDFVASSVATSTHVLSEDHVLLSGIWQITRRGADSGTPLRVSIALARRQGQWFIVQFHNSVMPG